MEGFKRKYEFESLNDEAAMLGSWRRRVDLVYGIAPSELKADWDLSPMDSKEVEAREIVANIDHTLIESTMVGPWLEEITSVRNELSSFILQADKE